MSNMYDILGKLKSVIGFDEKPVETAKETVYESVEPRGDIMEAVRSLEEKYMGFKKTVAAIEKGGSAENPEAVAAAIGRKKYGKKKFQKAAAAGKKLGEDTNEAIDPTVANALVGLATGAAMVPAHHLGQKLGKKAADWLDKREAKKLKKGVKEGEYDPAPVDPEAVAKRKRLQAIKDRQEAEREHGDDYKSNVRTVKGKAYGGAAQKDAPEADDLDEVAPPGAKAERMVKHIKKGYAKDGKLTKREKGIAYATAWKAHNKGQVEEGVEFGDTIKNSKAELKKAKLAKVSESRMLQEGDYFYEKVAKALAEKNPTLDTSDPSFVTAVRQEMVAQGIEPNRARNIIMMDDDFISDVATSYGHYCKEIAECNAPINSTLGGTTVEQELDEIARLAGLPVEETEVYNEVNVEESPDTMDEGNAFTGKLAQTKKGEKFELGGKEFTDTSDLGEAALEEEEEMGEGNEFSGALAKAKAAGAKEFEVDGKKYTVKEDVNLNITANGEEDVVKLITKLAGMGEVDNVAQAAQVARPIGITAAGLDALMAEPAEEELEEERDIEYVNTPREQIAPVDAAIPSGTDLHKSKEQYKKAQDGDNPMAVKEQVEDRLWKKYNSMIKTVQK